MEQVTLSWKRKTPEVIRNIRGGIMYGIGAMLPFAAKISQGLGITVDDFSLWCGLAIIAVRIISKSFGIPEEDEKKNNVA